MAIKKRILGNVIGPQGPQGPKGEDAPTTIDVLTSKLHMNSTNIGLTNGNILGIAHMKDSVVLVGGGGTIKYNDQGYSENYWRTADSPVSTNLHSVTYGKDKFVAVGHEGTIIYSAIGRTWNKVNIDISCTIRRVVYTNDRFIAVGDTGFIAYSINGIDWVISDNYDDHICCTDVAYGNGIYIVTTTSGAVYRSIDCIHWELIGLYSATFNAVTFVNGNFIVVGGGGGDILISCSEDGLTWDNYSIPGGNNAYRIIYAYNMYMICCDNGLYFSKDGKQWSNDWIFLENNIEFNATSPDMTCTEGGHLLITGRTQVYYAISSTVKTMDICDVINLLYTKVMFD